MIRIDHDLLVPDYGVYEETFGASKHGIMVLTQKSGKLNGWQG